MTLLGVKEENNWLFSEWKMTYPAGWEQIVKAIAALYGKGFESPELISDGRRVRVTSAQDIVKLREASGVTVKGLSRPLGVPAMIHLYNQTGTVRAVVAMAKEEFKTADYESFNKSMGQFMDSIELIMFS